jgi:hypothetical protein
MFKFFKRSIPAAKAIQARPVTRPAPSGAKSSRHDFVPAPLPEVVEGDGEADWSLWEDSVNLNSQLQPLSGFRDTGFRDTESAEISAFDKVGKRDR